MEDVVFNQLNALDDSTLGVIITDLLRDKPELAPALVTQAIPDLTFAPTKSLTDKGARCSGTIKSVTSELGHGLIDCPQLNSVFGCDVVVFPQQVGSFREGQSVNFAVTLADDSKPQAFDLIEEDTNKDMMTSMGGSMGGMSGMGMGMGGFMPGFGMGMMMNGNAGNAAVAKSAARPPNVEDSGDPGEEELGVFVGRFNVWNAEKGFGYIQCDALLDEGYSGEVVLHQHQRKNFQPGQDVSFTCVLRNGQLQAQELEHPRMATGRPMSFGEGMPPGKRYRSSWCNVPEKARNQALPKDPSLLEDRFAVCRAWGFPCPSNKDGTGRFGCNFFGKQRCDKSRGKKTSGMLRCASKLALQIHVLYNVDHV